jgi:hypothetical protein
VLSSSEYQAIHIASSDYPGVDNVVWFWIFSKTSLFRFWSPLKPP